MKESILNDKKGGDGEDTRNASNDATNVATSTTIFATGATRTSSDTYVCGVCIVAVLAIDASVVFAYNKTSYNDAIKEKLNEEQKKPIKPPK